MQRKSRRKSLSPSPAPYGISTPGKDAAASGHAATEEEVRVWLTNCMSSHVEEVAKGSHDKGLPAPSCPVAAASRRSSSGTPPPQRRRALFAQDAPVADFSQPSRRRSTSTGPRNLAARSSHFPLVTGGEPASAQPPSSCSGSVRSGGRRLSVTSNSSSLKAFSRSCSCDSLLNIHRLGFSKGMQASTETLATCTSEVGRPGGPDSAAGEGGSMKRSSSAPRSLAKNGSARHLGELLQQSCADRIQKLKADQHSSRRQSFDDRFEAFKGKLSHSASRGTTRIDSEQPTRVNSERSLATDLNLL